MKVVNFAVLAAIALTPAPAFAQCAGCGADRNKQDRERTERVAKEQKDSADKGRLRGALGDGMAGKAADKAKSHNDRNKQALDNVDKH